MLTDQEIWQIFIDNASGKVLDELMMYDHEFTVAARAIEREATKHERERCAQACDARVMGDNNREDAEASRCADAIRALKDE